MGMQTYGFMSVKAAVLLAAIGVAGFALAEPSVIPVYGGKKAMVAITYDDGLVSHYDVARPMHAKYKVGGTFFVPVTCADNPKKRNRHGDRCDWKMLLEMQAEGLEVASHTMTHANLRKLRDAHAYEQVTNEIVGAKAVFASHGIDVKTVAFGFNAKYDGAVALCRASGQYPRLYQFGTGSKDTPERYDELLKTKWSKENEYSILMIHGVTKATGGYNPIPTLETYEHLIRILAESPDVYAGDMKTCSAYRERAEHTRLRRDADGLYAVVFEEAGTLCGPGPVWVRLSDGSVVKTETGARFADR